MNPSRAVHGIVVTFNRPDDVVKSCQAALGQTIPLTSLTVVNNGIEKLDHRQLEALAPARTRLDVVEIGDNLGPAGGFEAGFRHIDGRVEDDDLVLVLDDDDPLPTQTVLGRLLDQLEQVALSDAALGGLALKGARFDPRRIRTMPVDPAEGDVQRVDHLHGGYAPLYVAGALRASGGFRPHLFWGFEELETGLRMTRAGFHLYMAVSVHRSMPMSVKDERLSSRPSLLQRNASPRRYYALRNLLWIGWRYGNRTAVIRVALVRGILKPLVSLTIYPRPAARQLVLNCTAIWHAARGRLGRTMTW